MIRVLMIFIIIYSLILTGCSNNQILNQNESSKYTKLSSSESTEQQISNEVKEKLKNRKEITTIHAVNTAELLIIAFEVSHFNRFNLAKIKKEIKKEIEEAFPKIDLIVSTDKKVVLELRKMESDIKTQSISKKSLTKKLKEIKNLSKDET